MHFPLTTQQDEPSTSYYDYSDPQSTWSSSISSNATSPMDEAIDGLFPNLTTYFETTHLNNERPSFQEAAQALKLHKDTTRKAQNRSAQRAYRERQQTRLRTMQATITSLTFDRDQLRVQVKDLESDLSRLRMEVEIQGLRSKRRNTLPTPEAQRSKRTGRLGSCLGREDGVGWMLKHIYGAEEAGDEGFGVFEVEEGREGK